MSGMKDYYFDFHNPEATAAAAAAVACPKCSHPMADDFCFYCGTGKRPAEKSEERREADEARAIAMWEDAIPIANTLAEHYLRHHRRIEQLPPDVDGVLRFHPRCPFGYKIYVPALVALFRAGTRPCGIHRTHIHRTQGKVSKPRAYGTLRHAAIKLWPAPLAGRLTIGEGIETVLAAAQLMPDRIPAWAVGTAWNIGDFPLLDEIHELHILVDNDPADKGRIGQRKASECAGNYMARGKAVYTHTPKQHKDFNDILRGQHHASR
jgi:hypothetical protein